MRRKTIAKRILDCEYEGEEEEYQKYEESDVRKTHSQVLCHRQQKRRKQLHPAKENGEEISPCDTGPQKLKTRAFESDSSIGGHAQDGDVTMEILEGLQSRSKAELIAMVLSMQREMDSLREQIQCLTACGKLARNLEGLVERTDLWLSHSRRTPSPSMPRVHLESEVVTQFATPVALNGRWAKMEVSSQHRSGQTEVNGELPQTNGTPLYQEFITTELLDRCNTGTTAQKLTNDLLRGLYDRDCLACHSISGIVNNKRGQPKPALPADEIQAILRAVQHYFPGKTDSEIKGYIRQKLQNEAKRLRKKPHLAEEPVVGSEGTETARAYT